MLLGRAGECARIDGVLDAARAGASGVLVLSGEAGVGKTALCRYAVECAQGFTILSARGAEAESHLPFAVLSELLDPALTHLDAIPAPQRGALATALALREGSTEPFAVYTATLSLLATAAEERPLLAVVDDAHWSDEPSAAALRFAARRLNAEGVVMLLALRDGERNGVRWEEHPPLLVRGLDGDAAGALIAVSAEGAVAAEVARRLIEATGGSPLALTELCGRLTAAQLSGRAPLDDPLPVGPRLEQVFGDRLRLLPAPTRRALLVAAASKSAAMPAILRALKALGLDASALEPAEADDLIHLGGDRDRLEFRHPLLRSAVYYGADPVARRGAHQALARAEESAVRRAWHLAASAVGPDEEVALALEHAGHDARQRAGHGAAASAFEHAARLSPEVEQRSRRLLEAAADAHLTGQPARALALLDQALEGTADPLLRADVQALRGMALTWCAPVIGAHDLLVAESALVEPLDASRAARMLAFAALPAFMAGRFTTALATARRAYALARGCDEQVQAVAGLALGEALIFCGRTEHAWAMLAYWQPPIEAIDTDAAISLATIAMLYVFTERYEAAESLVRAINDQARRSSALAVLPFMLTVRSELEFRTGRWTAAYAHASEAVRLAEELGQPTNTGLALCGLARIEAGRGAERDCLARLARMRALIEPVESYAVHVFGGTVLGLLYLGQNRHQEAIAALEPFAVFSARGGLGEPGATLWAPDLIEAYVRDGRTADAERALAVFARQGERTGRTWALAATARCRGLLAATAEAADAHFAAALSWHERTPTPFERARTELCWGERLRRAGQRTEARARLRAALEVFERLGARPWADRAAHELSASGARLRRRDTGGAQELTEQELHVALVVAKGMTNREAAAALFLSPKTVEFHLSNIYRKLNLRSRTELTRHLAATGALDS